MYLLRSSVGPPARKASFASISYISLTLDTYVSSLDDPVEGIIRAGRKRSPDSSIEQSGNETKRLSFGASEAHQPAKEFSTRRLK